MGTKVPKILGLARGQGCVCCGTNDGTVVACHYQGFRSHSFGKGTGSKPSDLFVAFLCSKCHAKMDTYENTRASCDLWSRKVERSEEFMCYILRTWDMLHKQGHIKIVK